MYNALIALLLTSCIAIGQVNIEQYRTTSGELKEKYHEFVNIATSLRRSTTSYYKVKLQYFRPFYMNTGNGFLVSKVNYGETEGNPFENNSFYHLRFISKKPIYQFFPEVFFQYENNSYALTNRRYLFGLGVRYQYGIATIGTTAISESYRESDGILKTNNWRISQYLKTNINLNENNDINIMLYIQPNIAKFSDIRYYSESSYVNKINELIAYKSTLIAKYFSESNDFKNVEIFFESGLQFKL